MPVFPANAFDFLSHSSEQTRRLGMRLGALIQKGDVVCLQGELGAGKTTFVQGLAAGWGSLDDVSSPTFILVNIYRRADGGQLFHFDTYRIETAPEAEELDLDEMLGSGPLVIEWPERMLSVLPDERLWIRLEYVDEDLRRLTFMPKGKNYENMLDAFRKTSFGTDTMLLAVDTSTSQIGLALYDGAQVLAESLWTGKSRHTVELAPAVAGMLAHTGLKATELRALGVAIGPGSFTSLRVGLAFIKGLALACSLPVIAINTLDVVAATQPESNLPLACLLPAGRGRLALCWYQAPSGAWQVDGKAQIITAQALTDSIERAAIVCGDLSASERQILKKNPHIRLVSPALSVRRPAVLAELAYSRWQAGEMDDIASLTPVYLHIAEPIPDPANAQEGRRV